jgi:hypothetical protein
MFSFLKAFSHIESSYAADVRAARGESICFQTLRKGALFAGPRMDAFTLKHDSGNHFPPRSLNCFVVTDRVRTKSRTDTV